MLIDLNNPNSDIIKITKFPDSQSHVTIKPSLYTPVNINISLDSSDKIMLLLQTVDAVKRAGYILNELFIKYFYGARSDRIMQSGDSIEALIIADLINKLDFRVVKVLDIHNLSTGLHINNFQNISFDITDYSDKVLILPDLGAYKKYENIDCLDKILCVKTRDNQGNISLKVLEPEKCLNKVCIVKDDLIDGGATFIAIAEQLQFYSFAQQCGYNKLILECTHGIFSKGVDELLKYYDEIITTNSYTKQPAEVLNNHKITLIDVQGNYEL